MSESTNQPLNLSRLHEPANYKELVWLEKWRIIGYFLLIAVVSTAVILFVQFWASGSNSAVQDNSEMYWAIVFILGITAMTILTYYVERLTQKYRNISAQNFAEDNRFLFTPNAYPHSQDWPGIIFDHGEKPALDQLIEGTHGNQHFWIANYSYEVPGSRSSRREDFGIIRIELPRMMPHVLLDGTANNPQRLTWISNLPSIAGFQKYELEGDFGKYFTLYAPRNYERDTLYFLTPELMALLVDRADNYDIEIVDDNLFIYMNEPLKFTPEGMSQAFTLMETLGLETRENTDRYRDSRAGSASSALTSEAQKGYVASAGRRLKRSPLTILTIIIIIWIVFQFGSMLFQTIILPFFLNN